MPIVTMRREHAQGVAQLHCHSIRTGLTAWLGPRFCKQLYLGLADTPYSFVLVYEDDGHVPLGFICCACNTTKMYRHVLRHRFFALLMSAIGKLLRPSVLRCVWLAIRRPQAFTSGELAVFDLPEAELVSIGVSPESQGRKIGTQLVETAFARFREMGCNRVRVWTSEDNDQATAFYRKRGFRLLGESRHHTGGIRLFLADLREPAELGYHGTVGSVSSCQTD